MITVLRAYGLRIAIYTDDHPPPHVHVLGDGEAKIRLVGPGGQPVVMQVVGMKKADVAKALKVVADEQAELLKVWRTVHG
jgi:hypothetical protein